MLVNVADVLSQAISASAVSVRIASSWAFANLCASSQIRVLLRTETGNIPGIPEKLVDCAFAAARDADKVCLLFGV